MKSPQAFRLLVPAVVLAAIGCSAYDEGLLTARRSPSGGGLAGFAGGGAGGTSAGAAAAGSGGLAAAGNTAGAAGAPAAGSGGQSGGPASAPQCGDGRVDPGETCDTGILPGVLGACPTVCEAPDSCERWSLSGSGCGVTCVPSALSCMAGDGCCPSECTHATDSDCSAICGDGVVQAERGETCELNAAAEMMRCPAAADCDDADVCTTDAVRGSAENCTAVCIHEPVRTPRDGDGCCPSGADAGTDSDCVPACGNGVREGSEECDGSTGCDGACKLVITGAQAECLERFGASACETCQCENCADEVMACRASGSAARDRHCTAVEQCATEANCSGDACYCGSASRASCALRPSGPCADVIEAAAGTSLSLSIQQQYGDSNTALGRARALGECRRRNCDAACP